MRPLGVYWLALLVLGLSLQLNGWTETWEALSIPSMSPIFADMRSVQGGLQAVRSGIDPQLENPDDPWQRRMNYPSAWLRIAELFHFETEGGFLTYCGLQLALFLGIASFLLVRFPSFWLVAALLSSACLLAMERGNNDLLIYGVVTLAVVQPSPAIGSAGALAASLLKVYPLVLLPQVLERFGTRRGAAAVAGAVVAGLFAITTLDELAVIRQGTPSFPALSYGVGQLRERMELVGLSGIPDPVISLALIAGCFVWVARHRNRPGSASLHADGPDLQHALFLTSTLLYAGTFLLASNLDYRLVFLALAVPALTIESVHPMRRTLLTCILLSMNATLLWRLGVVGSCANEVAKLAVFLLMLCGLIDRTLDRFGRGPLGPLLQRLQARMG